MAEILNSCMTVDKMTKSKALSISLPERELSISLFTSALAQKENFWTPKIIPCGDMIWGVPV